MTTSILSVGIACVIAGIIGGGLRTLGVEIPVIQSAFRQVCLIVFGFVLIFIGYNTSKTTDSAPKSSMSSTEPTRPTAQPAAPVVDALQATHLSLRSLSLRSQ